ncbi:MAG: hypothetical protein AAGJ32_06380 [Pseudomonadota bacterium]
MAYRVALQVAVFLLPFIMYGVYRLVLADAEADGRKIWPINTLFGTGAALTIGLWVALAVQEPKERSLCNEPAQVVDGVLIPGRQVPCPDGRETINVGAPMTNEPGAPARGFGVRPRDDVSRADEVARPPRPDDAPEEPVEDTPSDDTR